MLLQYSLSSFNPGVPDLCRHDHEELPERLEIPELPDNFKLLDREQQSEASTQQRHKKMVLFYTAVTLLQCQNHIIALHLPHLRSRQAPIKNSSARWKEDLVPPREVLASIRDKWDRIAQKSNRRPYPDPDTYTEDEKPVHA